MAAINPEILVCCQDNGISEDSRHAYKACVGETHWNVGVLFDQFCDWLQVFGELEGDNKSMAAKSCAKGCSPLLPQEMIRFRDSRLACRPRWREIGRPAHSPAMTGIALAKQWTTNPASARTFLAITTASQIAFLACSQVLRWAVNGPNQVGYGTE